MEQCTTLQYRHDIAIYCKTVQNLLMDINDVIRSQNDLGAGYKIIYRVLLAFHLECISLVFINSFHI